MNRLEDGKYYLGLMPQNEKEEATLLWTFR
jgi:hypothetical protein